MKLIFHHTAVRLSDNKRQLWSVNRYHKQKFNMKSQLGWYVGYTYFIDGDGTVTQTRNHDEEGAHTIGFNKGHIAICTAGNFLVEMPTEAQKRSLRNLILKLQALYPNIELSLHKLLQANRTCPGNLSLDYINNLLSIDGEKEVEIASLNRKIDFLWSIIRRLMMLLSTRK